MLRSPPLPPIPREPPPPPPPPPNDADEIDFAPPKRACAESSLAGSGFGCDRGSAFCDIDRNPPAPPAPPRGSSFIGSSHFSSSSSSFSPNPSTWYENRPCVGGATWNPPAAPFGDFGDGAFGDFSGDFGACSNKRSSTATVSFFAPSESFFGFDAIDLALPPSTEDFTGAARGTDAFATTGVGATGFAIEGLTTGGATAIVSNSFS
mmetsp:Transcript_8270/g.30247  ORF Transcript_8270/g.30247 Transcript_8270/m.30247 type:complete len:207 (+) Transcript_8270:459-1079(+)